MRKVVYGGAISLDGYLARENGAVDWLIMTPEAMEIMQQVWPRFDVMVMGRKTFTKSIEMFSEEDLKKAEEMKGVMRSIVFSRTLDRGELAGYEIVNEDAAEFVRDLKAQGGKDIMLMGGGELAKSLFEADLIDEIGFNIHPILLGSGIPTFLQLSKQVDLELIEARPLSAGCVYVSYNVKN
ncbi:MAG TPA: dihydrofolate reductase family protein [Pyrinomonadaceae bacterium]|nr:dihydrofolate reductase family protein [Pyrinomonadaceae bacterium]